ncbi:F0F1 ATP synthase subunit A [Leptolyngbya iicbica]|uniref:ATP synthase subunit a n=2 Tax=Cyanophyceae TaxID=3028117 RepID=A0A4Q7EGW6_9CYAN|nr:F0F1 ATP synthase subunit A [Leptolyngbya sp. LK]RZM82228.1 F0F1 ATP synthase subunit A [Leptolyngbya sp. LK]
MEITPDHIIYWQSGFFKLNATLVFSWVTMLVLVFMAGWVTRHLAVGPDRISRWQHGVEIIVTAMRDQIGDASRQDARPFLPFIGTLFLFIATANIIEIIPGLMSPAASLSTTLALALCVFIAVPLFGIQSLGWGRYLQHYIEPTPVMLPFNLISELSRTIALAIRLFGNVMSTSLLVAILLSIVPLFFPVVMQAFGLLVGVIQAYVFAILAMVYIASGMRRQQAKTDAADATVASEGQA